MKFKSYEYADQPRMPYQIETNAPVEPLGNGRSYFTIEHLKDNQRITIAGYDILVNSFLKRNYIFKDDRTPVSRKQLKKAHIFADNGFLLVEGRLAFWDSVYKRDAALVNENFGTEAEVDKKSPEHAEIENSTSLVDGKQLVGSNPREQAPQPEEVGAASIANGLSIKGLSRTCIIKMGRRNIRIDSFLKRHYTFDDNDQQVPKELLKEAIVFPDGTVTVNKRAATWNGSKRGHEAVIKIGEENPITQGAFLKRTEIDRKTLKYAQIDEKAGTVKLSDRLIVRQLPEVKEQQIEQQVFSYPLQPLTLMDVSSEVGAPKRKWDQIEIGTPSNMGFFLPLHQKNLCAARANT